MTMNQSTALSPVLLREAIATRCRAGSWFALRPLFLQMQAAPEVGPEWLAELLASTGVRSCAEAGRLQRVLSQGLWQASTERTQGTRQNITVCCGTGRWAIRLLFRPHVHIETISRLP